jgi:hypothetical protein
MRPQKPFLAQDLPVYEQRENHDSHRRQYIVVNKEQAQKERDKADVNRIAAESEHSVSDELIGLFLVNADAKGIAETDQARGYAEHGGKAKNESNPSGYDRRPKRRDQRTPHRQSESVGKDGVDDQQYDRHDQKIRLIRSAEHDRLDASAPEHCRPSRNADGEQYEQRRADTVLNHSHFASFAYHRIFPNHITAYHSFQAEK